MSEISLEKIIKMIRENLKRKTSLLAYPKNEPIKEEIIIIEDE
mgnify:CR=1 FL=1